MRFINYNGNILAADSVTILPGNTAFRYGYGLFETILILNGAIQLQHYHCERLFNGLSVLGFSIPSQFNVGFIEQNILKLVASNGCSEYCRVRLQVWAEDLAQTHPAFIIETIVPTENITAFNARGLKVGFATGCSTLAGGDTANLKTTSRLGYMMAAQQSHSRGFDDMFIANQYQRPVETSIANVFWVKDGTIFTPPLTEGCVAGVMRRHVLAASARLGFTVKEAILTKKQLFDADEAFLTNAIRRIKWIEEIEGYRYGNELTASLHAAVFKIAAGS